MEKQKNQQPESVISYHNKDIVSKLFGEKLKHKSFERRLYSPDFWCLQIK